MAGKPTDVIEDWTYGPVRWIGAGLVIGAAAVGIAWSVSARRVPVTTPIPVQAPIKAAAASTKPAATIPESHAPRSFVTELPPRESATAIAAETPQAEPDESSPGPININAATTEQLEKLPGIGPGLAARIVDDRTKKGRFRSIKDLDRVPGIGPKLLERVGPLVVFE
ncbi:MAG: ComEA family DNA-binding protein [Phycisphaerales bacterium]